MSDRRRYYHDAIVAKNQHTHSTFYYCDIRQHTDIRHRQVHSQTLGSHRIYLPGSLNHHVTRSYFLSQQRWPQHSSNQRHSTSFITAPTPNFVHQSTSRNQHYSVYRGRTEKTWNVGNYPRISETDRRPRPQSVDLCIGSSNNSVMTDSIISDDFSFNFESSDVDTLIEEDSDSRASTVLSTSSWRSVGERMLNRMGAFVQNSMKKTQPKHIVRAEALKHKPRAPLVTSDSNDTITISLGMMDTASIRRAKRRPIIGDAGDVDAMISPQHRPITKGGLPPDYYSALQRANVYGLHQPSTSSANHRSPSVTPTTESMPRHHFPNVVGERELHRQRVLQQRQQHESRRSAAGDRLDLPPSRPARSNKQQPSFGVGGAGAGVLGLELQRQAMRRISMRRSRSQPMQRQQQMQVVQQQNAASLLSPMESPPSSTSPTAVISRTSADESITSSGYRSSVHSTGGSSTATTSSFASCTDGGNEHPSTSAAPHELLTEALWDHITMQSDELPFAVGDRVVVTDWSRDSLWYGACNDRHGWFPPSYVRTLTNQLPPTPVHKSNPTNILSDGKPTPQPSTSSRDSGHSSTNEEESFLDEDNLSATSTEAGNQREHATYSAKKWKMRWRIVDEILSTERDYHNLIARLVQGFVQAARNRKDLFPADKLRVIFGNLEDILTLHNRFLLDLENEYNKDDPSATCVGHSFLRHETDFEVYSDYCNNRPLSCAELGALGGSIQYDKFFECCRLLCDLPPLPLDGFLLTPVQRICRYPLQLAELVKATPSNHPDYAPCTKALHAMRRVATVINDRKRRLESLQKLAIWQSAVTGWKGDDLLTTSCRLYHYGELSCRHVKNKSTVSNKDLSCFLFDRCIIMCRRDMLKRTQLMYKNRIMLDNVNFVDVADGKDTITGVNCKSAIRLDVYAAPTMPHIDDPIISDGNETPSVVEHHYILSCRSRKNKQRWLTAFTDEQVESRETKGKHPISIDEKRIALAALNSPYEMVIANSAMKPSATSAELTRRVKQRTASVTQLQSKMQKL